MAVREESAPEERRSAAREDKFHQYLKEREALLRAAVEPIREAWWRLNAAFYWLRVVLWRAQPKGKEVFLVDFWRTSRTRRPVLLRIVRRNRNGRWIMRPVRRSTVRVPDSGAYRLNHGEIAELVRIYFRLEELRRRMSNLNRTLGAMARRARDVQREATAAGERCFELRDVALERLAQIGYDIPVLPHLGGGAWHRGEYWEVPLRIDVPEGVEDA